MSKLISIPHIALVKSLHRIANGTFDPKMRLNPDAMAREVAASLPSLNETSERRALGLQLSSGRRDIYVAEQSPGALDAAKIDKGTIGELVRDLSRTGFLTKNPNKLDDVLRDARADENSSARAYLRRVRKNKATVQEEAAIARDAHRLHRLRELVDAGEAIIARDIRHTVDCRDIAVNWPIEWTRGMPVPIASAHVRGGAGWVAKNYQQEATRRYIGAAEVNPVSAFDYGAVGSRVAAETTELHGITFEDLALQEAIDACIDVALPSDAEIERVTPRKPDTENVILFRPGKKRPEPYPFVMFKSIRRV